ncbi:MAG: amino acid adenylation domain-containing protein [Candidatus Competibacteraceae bacterium]
MKFQTFELTQNQLLMLETTEYGGNRCAVFRLEGPLDEARLSRAVQQVIRCCLPFAYKFLKVDDAWQIFLSPDHQGELRVIDASTGGQETVYALIENYRNRRFRLDGGAPYLFCLLRGQPFNHLVFVCHPALIDRFSLKPLFAALSTAYQDGELPETLGLPQDILIETEKHHLAGMQYAESLRFWLQLARDAAFEWRPARLESDLADTYFSFTLSEARTATLAQLARKLDIGLDHLLLFAFHLFLFRVTRNETVLTAYCHRIRTGSPDQIGFNENKPIFKSLLVPEQSVAGFLRRAAWLFTQARFHSDIPSREVIRELLRLNPGYRWPTNVLFDEDTLPYRELALDGITTTLLPFFSHRLESEDIAIHFDLRDCIAFHVLARSPQDISGLNMAFAHYLALLDHLPEDLDRPVAALRLFTEPLQHQALTLADGGALVTPAVDVLVQFAAACARHPDAPALSFGDVHLSYAQLSQSAGSVAAHLQTHCASHAEPLIGICLSRSERMIQAIFGVLATGAGYLPLDPQMPAERLGFIASDAQLAVVIADAATRDTIAAMVDCPVCAIEDLLDVPVPLPIPVDSAETARRIAYVIYTSGTTGKPKGVVIERGMLAHFVASLEGVWERGPGSRWLQFASVNFDASVLEIFNPLTHGGELIVAPSEARADPEAVFRLLREGRITHAFVPPALLRLLPRHPLPDLTTIFCGGEASDEETVRFWSKAVELANIYGPTETTVLATVNRMGGYKAANQLGRPLPGYQTYLLDSDEQLTPLGGIGEIGIGGPAVAREYLGRPELTAQKFRPNPYGPGRIYRTGDLGRFLPNGDLEFLGRSDFQVKIRGFRIELGDIESIMAEQPEVKGVYVGVFDYQGSKALLAWYVTAGLAAETLRERLAKRLPHYMIPAFLIPIPAFPLNLSGKIDRTRLPMPTPDQAPVGARLLDKLEQQVRELWATVLNVAPATLGATSHFFHLGGHSLLAALVCSRLSAALGNTIRPRSLFEHPVLADFCEQVRGTPQTQITLPPLTATRQLAAPMDNRLIGLIYSRTIRFPDDNTYNIVIRVDFSPEIHPLRLRQAFHDLLEAHPVFRAAFTEQHDRIWLKAADLTLPTIPLVDATPAGMTARAEALRVEPLGVAHAPLWRAEIMCTADSATTLVFCVHHAIFDGWSLNLFLQELADRYEGRPVGLRLNWFDYCLWARCLPDSQPFADSIAYWKTKLAAVDAHTELPTDFRQKQANANAALRLRFAPEVVAELKTFADAQNITLPPVLFALFLTWIWRLSGQEELVCGYPYAGRDIPGSEEIYGMFVTMGFLRQTVRPQHSFRDLALAVHRQMIDDKEHLLATPYDAEIAGLDALNLIFSLQSGIGLEGGFGGATYQADELPSLTSKADLTGIFYQSSDGAIEGRIEFDGSLFRPETVAGFLNVFNTLVTAAARRPEARVSELTYQSEADLTHFLDLACGPHLETPDTSIPAQFAAMVQARPDHPALIFESHQTSYRELADWSDGIAAGLSRQVAPGSRIGLSLQKSEGLVATVLAILKLGCAYVPLDPSYPPERLRFFVENCAVRFVAADTVSRAALSNMGLAHLNFIDPLAIAIEPAAPLPPVAPDTLAYIIHTSGSTGQPKGVMIEHSSVVRLALATVPALDFAEDGIGSLIASMNFDASVLELFLCLLTGRTLVIIPEATRKDPVALHQTLRDQGVTHVVLSPVVLQNLPREPLPALRMIGFGGDVIDEPTADWWSRQTRLFSLYGPTETTVMASLGQILPGTNPRMIGKPLAGYRLYLLNRYRQPVPQGTIGEICIGGDGLARGYLNRDDLTMERFILDPLGGSPYAQIYLTGDLGRYLPEGTIEFFGRNDAQIKLRGFRIELGEIETALGAFPELRQVACATKGEGDHRYLAAYYVAGHDLDEDAMRQHLARLLPDYMIPAFFVRLAALPASPSGKIDRKALPAIAGKVSAHPPRAGLEQQIAEIWEDILRFRGMGRDESFFRVGGNSLLAVRMQAEVRKRLGLEFAMGEFYGAPTIEALAAGHKTSHIQQAIQEAQAGIFIAQPAPKPVELTRPHTVLLTGASGFLGIFLLAELTRQVETVDCLLRCRDEAAGLETLRKQLETAGLSADLARVRIVPGDLALPELGLTDAVRQRLATEVDAVLHCGAFVHHLHSYATMKAANVDSTLTLLELALTEKQKPFCFVSTLSVATALEGVTCAAEAILPNLPVVDNGYLLTKWVGEQLVAQCAARYGLPAVIARPGNITGHSTTGFSNYAHNHFWLFNQGCLQLGAFPAVASPVEMTPVDVLAQAIVALMLAPRTGVLVANLSNPNTLGQQEFFQKLATCGFPAVAEPPADWQPRLTTIGEDNGLSQIKEFYTGDLSGEAPPVEQSATLAALAALGVNYSADYTALIPTYVAYLRREGFLG